MDIEWATCADSENSVKGEGAFYLSHKRISQRAVRTPYVQLFLEGNWTLGDGVQLLLEGGPYQNF